MMKIIVIKTKCCETPTRRFIKIKSMYDTAEIDYDPAETDEENHRFAVETFLRDYARGGNKGTWVCGWQSEKKACWVCVDSSTVPAICKFPETE